MHSNWKEGNYCSKSGWMPQLNRLKTARNFSGSRLEWWQCSSVTETIFYPGTFRYFFSFSVSGYTWIITPAGSAPLSPQDWTERRFWIWGHNVKILYKQSQVWRDSNKHHLKHLLYLRVEWTWLLLQSPTSCEGCCFKAGCKSLNIYISYICPVSYTEQYWLPWPSPRVTMTDRNFLCLTIKYFYEQREMHHHLRIIQVWAYLFCRDDALWINLPDQLWMFGLAL